VDEFGGLRSAAKKREAARRRSRLLAGLVSNAFLGLASLVFAAAVAIVGAAFGPQVGLSFPLERMGLLGEIAASIAPAPTSSGATTAGEGGGDPGPEATLGLPSPFPTATESLTPTATASRTPTQTPLPSSTPTVTLTPSRTPVRSQTPTPSETPFGTPPPTSTFTPSPAPIETAFPDCSPSENSGFENVLLGLINDERKAAGLPAYVQDAQLRAAARTHSTDMACNGFFSHTGSDGSSVGERVTGQGYEWTLIAENIFATGDTSSNAPQLALDFWMAGATHRASILSEDFSEVGIGYIHEPDSPFGGYFTVVFAQP